MIFDAVQKALGNSPDTSDIYHAATLSDLLSDLDKEYGAKERTEAIKMLQVDRLPYFAKHKKTKEISECLKVEDLAVQNNVCSHLQELILQLPRRFV